MAEAARKRREKFIKAETENRYRAVQGLEGVEKNIAEEAERGINHAVRGLPEEKTKKNGGSEPSKRTFSLNK